jgi:energy-coupling factor transporter ATP-binding protein EcfA2
MRVERLEVFGFKSFMERLVLPLEDGITGVVGPNGCGKSNIIDALRWVLGETRASQLRGGVLEDVIFNGTETLRPLGLAEVSVVIRAEKDNLLNELVQYYENAEISVLAAPIPAANDDATASQDEARQTVPEKVEDELAPVLVTAAPMLPQQPANEDSVEQATLGEEVNQESGEAAQPEALAHDFLADIKASLSKYSWLQSLSEVQVTRRLYRSGESEFFINKV